MIGASHPNLWGLAWLLGLGCAGCGADNVPKSAKPVSPSCVYLGEGECQGESCCKTLAVPAQSFTLGGVVEWPTAAATVSEFSLDKYEVTVGRFQTFISAYDEWRGAGNPVAGAGAHPLIADSGWQEDWSFTETAADIDSQAGVKCSPFLQTITAGRADAPINCVTWFEAFAFCVWDGGRLPTEAEWEAAATGGDEGRPFPWGTDAPDPSRSAYDCTGDGSAAQDCAISDILDVGSKPAGAGRWGHRDLAGNVWEWVLDYYRAYPATALDYASVATESYRSIRGSGWYSLAEELRSPIRYNTVPTARRSEFGFRCAGRR